jgi:adenylate cyclase
VELLVVGLGRLIFAWLNHSPRVGIGIAVVGLVTSTSIYLLLDRPIRPLIDLAQAGQVLGRRQRDVERRIWLFWLLGSGLPFSRYSRPRPAVRCLTGGWRRC